MEIINKMKLSKLNKNTILTGGTILDPVLGKEKKGNVHIVDGKIKSIANTPPPKTATIIDCKGLIITHGFCDIHSHFREPGREIKKLLNLELLQHWLEVLQEFALCLILILR